MARKGRILLVLVVASTAWAGSACRDGSGEKQSRPTIQGSAESPEMRASIDADPPALGVAASGGVTSTLATTVTGFAPTSADPAPLVTRPGDISIRATVAVTFASARVITLAAPVSGFGDVAIGADTRYRRANGQSITLSEIAPGAVIEVRGQPVSSTTLMASEVVLFTP